MNQLLHALATVRIGASAPLSIFVRRALPSLWFWMPRVAPVSISLLQAPLPTAFLLLGHAQRAVVMKLGARFTRVRGL